MLIAEEQMHVLMYQIQICMKNFPEQYKCLKFVILIWRWITKSIYKYFEQCNTIRSLNILFLESLKHRSYPISSTTQKVNKVI